MDRPIWTLCESPHAVGLTSARESLATHVLVTGLRFDLVSPRYYTCTGTGQMLSVKGPANRPCLSVDRSAWFECSNGWLVRCPAPVSLPFLDNLEKNVGLVLQEHAGGLIGTYS